MAWETPRTWSSGELVTAALMNSQIKGNEDILKTAINDSGQIEFTDATELTIASGVITVTQNFHKVDTQSDAGSDDLDTITAGTNVAAGFILVLRVESGARTVVLKNGTSAPDNLDIGTDITLDETYKTYSLVYDGTNWRPLTIDAAATTAAGSDTQVQYNDGGTNFGGDAGLVYNDSTDLLTTGKLATTDTGTTSIDVAGGITAGTGNVALVGVDGKIQGPLSSTIIDDLSGANLTTLNASALSSGTVATARLGSGTADSTTFLRGDGAWNTAGGSYKILQVHNFVYTAQVSSTSATMATTNVTDTITLADSNNKCLVIATIGGIASAGNTGVSIRLQRAISGGATSTVTGGNMEHSAGYTADAGQAYVGGSTMTVLDNPETASALTYTIEFSNASASGTVYCQVGNGKGTLTLMEVEV